MFSRRLLLATLALATTVPFVSIAPALAEDAPGFRPVPPGRSQPNLQRVKLDRSGQAAPETPAVANDPPSVQLPRFRNDAPGIFEARLPGVTCVANANGITLVPHFDGLARTDLGLCYRIQRATAGSHVVFARAAQPVLPGAAADATVVFRHAGIEERYEARPEGVEQSFAIASDVGLRTGADLVIAGLVETTLAPTPEGNPDARGGIIFGEGSRGVLRYGEATAIDAAGARIAAPIALDPEGVLTITVPGQWLATAAFPIVIDPLLGAVIQVTNTATTNERFPQIAYSATSDRFLVVWEEEISATNHDISGQLYGGNGLPIGGKITIDNFADDSLKPAVAWNAVNNVFLVAWEETPGVTTPGLPNSILGALIDSNGVKVGGPANSIFLFQALDVPHNVALGGRTGEGRILLVFDIFAAGLGVDIDIAFFQVDANGATGPNGVLVDGGGDDVAPKVNPLGQGTAPWFVCWTNLGFAPDTDLAGVPVTPTAGVNDLFPTTNVDPATNGVFFALTGLPERKPVVAGLNPWVVAFEREVTTTPLNVDVRAVTASALPITVSGSTGIATLTTSNEMDPSLSFYNGAGGTPEYLFAYTVATGTTRNVGVFRVNTTLTAAVEAAAMLTSSGLDSLPAAVGRAGTATPEHWIAFQRANPGNVDILLQRFGAIPPVPVADFTANPTTGAAPLAVTFTDLSTRTPSAWAWTFGDGGTDNVQNPTHSYTTPGAFDVTLVATGLGGPSLAVTKDDLVKIPPVANFTFAATGVPLQIQFTDTSTLGVGTISYIWDFGDGSPTSTLQNPLKTYASPAAVTVTLTVTGPGGSDDAMQNLAFTPPVASFTFSPSPGLINAAVNFTDTSTGGTITSRNWDFGDNTTPSTAQNPAHTYATNGAFTVTFTATGPGGVSMQSQTVNVTADANFNATPATTGPAPLTVNFSSTTAGTVNTFSWVFGDGGTGTGTPISHTYTTPGIYTVSLTVDGAGGMNTETKTNLITAQPTARFTATPSSGPRPLTVAFDAGTSTVAPGTTFSWNFGDNTTGTGQTVSHQYTTDGQFTVTLTVNGPGGMDTETATIGVTPDADFSPSAVAGSAPFTVQFTNLTSGSGTITYAWAFGDGGTSTATNPAHTYTAAGTYTVTLTATGPGGPNVETKTNLIVVGAAGAPPVAEFTANPRTGVPPLTVQFTDQSTAGSAAIQSYSWDFGDGTTSTARNPMHTYATSGTFSVTLTVRDTAGQTATRTQPNLIVTNPLAGGGGGGATFQVRNRGGGGGGCALADTGTHPSAALPFAAALVGLVLLRLRSRRRRLEAATLPRA